MAIHVRALLCLPLLLTTGCLQIFGGLDESWSESDSTEWSWDSSNPSSYGNDTAQAEPPPPTAIEMMGAVPDEDFSTSGRISFSVLPKDGEDTGQATFVVQNDDGTYSDCTFLEESTRAPRQIASMAIVIDDSGSMENIYGYTCPTCPHDPQRERAAASLELVRTVLELSPSSALAVYDFGPEPDAGRQATRVFAALTSDEAALAEGFSRVDGSQRVGTPLWDALAEVTVEHGQATADYEDDLISHNKSIDSGQPIATRYVLVISDGEDSASELHHLESVLALAEENEVIIHAVGLGPAAALDGNVSYYQDERIAAIQSLQAISRRSGGFYGSVDSPASMRSLFGNIALSMTDGYVVGTWSCLPRRNQSDSEPRVTQSGEEVHGIMYIHGEAVPWTVVTP